MGIDVSRSTLSGKGIASREEEADLLEREAWAYLRWVKKLRNDAAAETRRRSRKEEIPS